MLANVMNDTREGDNISAYLDAGGGLLFESGALAYNINLGTQGTDSRMLDFLGVETQMRAQGANGHLAGIGPS